MGLPKGPSLPGFVQTFLWIRRPIELMRSCRQKFGRVFTIRIEMIGDVVFLSDPEAIRQVFTGDPDALRAGSVNAVLRPLLGDASLLLLDGREHLRQRKLLSPPFHGENVRRYAAAMAEIADRVSEGWTAHETVVLRPAMQRMTLEIILRVVFGFETGPALDRMRAVLERLLSIADSGYGAVALVPALRRDWPGSPWRKFLRDRAEADALIYDQIRRRKRSLEKGERHDDVLDVLLQARDEAGLPIEERELRDELMTLLVAGHETTATALCWSFERVLSDDRVLRCLRDTVDAAQGTIDGADSSNLEYIDAVVKEALRTRPIVPIVGRRVFEKQSIAGHDIEPGAVLAPCIYLTHREADQFPEPDVFRPERFIGRRPDPYAWFPFGGGARRCVGMAFALFEMRVIIARLFSRFSFRLDEPKAVGTVRRAVTFAPRGGVHVRVERRA
ncbi:MAG TPA: cytochrome P450 [Polyangiaceae bacterium]